MNMTWKIPLVFGTLFSIGAPPALGQDLWHGKHRTERSIQLEVEVDAPPAIVFDLWTTVEGIRRFLAPDARIDPQVGGEFTIIFDPVGDAEGAHWGTRGGKILQFEPTRFLAFEWKGKPGMTEMRTHPLPVWVELEFEPRGEGGRSTFVRFSSHGYGRGAEWDEAYRYFSETAWPLVLRRLKETCATRNASADFETGTAIETRTEVGTGTGGGAEVGTVRVKAGSEDATRPFSAAMRGAGSLADAESPGGGDSPEGVVTGAAKEPDSSDRSGTGASESERAGPYRPTFYAMLVSPGPNWRASWTSETELVETHLAYMNRLRDQGYIVLAGPFTDGTGGLTVLRVESEAKAKALFSQEPLVVAGLMRFEVHAWSIVISSPG